MRDVSAGWSATPPVGHRRRSGPSPSSPSSRSGWSPRCAPRSSSNASGRRPGAGSRASTATRRPRRVTLVRPTRAPADVRSGSRPARSRAGPRSVRRPGSWWSAGRRDVLWGPAPHLPDHQHQARRAREGPRRPWQVPARPPTVRGLRGPGLPLDESGTCEHPRSRACTAEGPGRWVQVSGPPPAQDDPAGPSAGPSGLRCDQR
jgi:hypothetical protein